MNIRIEEFFTSPSVIGLIGLIALILGNVAIIYIQHRNGKKIRSDNRESKSEQITLLQKLTNQIQILIDNTVNTVNLQSAEDVITATLRQAESQVKDEVIRIFDHNHRSDARRQQIISKAVNSVVDTVYDNCMTTLRRMYYRERNLAEHLTDFDKRNFAEELLAHIFEKSESDKQDLADALYYVHTYFTNIITNAKSYYNS